MIMRYEIKVGNYWLVVSDIIHHYYKGEKRIK